nr:MAG TPA: hypothetical protein [Caudoviricetes sp.]
MIFSFCVFVNTFIIFCLQNENFLLMCHKSSDNICL